MLCENNELSTLYIAIAAKEKKWPFLPSSHDVETKFVNVFAMLGLHCLLERLPKHFSSAVDCRSMSRELDASPFLYFSVH